MALKTAFCLITFVLISGLSHGKEKCDVDIKAVLTEIQERLENKEQRLEYLERSVKEQRMEIAGLKSDLTREKARVSALEDKTSKVKDDNCNDKNNSVVIPANTQLSKSKQRTTRQAENEAPVAFYAALTDHITHAGQLQNIPFDYVLTNIGDAYTAHAGLFTAPVSGIYVFSATVTSYPHQNALFSFLKNGSPVSHMHPHSNDDSPAYDTASQTIVLRLNKGDDISVANRYADESLFGHRHSVFSGFLLQQIYAEDPSIVG